MTQGPTFEKVCALALYARTLGMCPKRLTVFFEDVDEDDPRVPDIDVRAHYPPGSSAFEQVLLARCPAQAERYAELVGILNANNATGYLKRDAYGQGSLVELIRRVYDLRDPRACAVTAWRRKIIKRFLRVAETALLFYGFGRELDTGAARMAFRDTYPQYADGPLEPFTLNGYGYALWLMDPLEFARVFPTDVGYFRARMREVTALVGKRKAEIKAAALPLYRSPKHGTRVLYLEVETDIDAKAAFRAYPKADIVVAVDRRTRVPRTAILPRLGRPVVREMHAIHVAFARREPDAWYAKERPDSAQMLLNGSTSRAPKVVSALVRSEASLMGALLLAVEDMYCGS